MAAFVSDGFVAAWDDQVLGLVGRRFANDGAPRAGAFSIAANEAPPAVPFTGVVLRENHEPCVAVRSDGSFLVAWVEQKVNRSVDILERSWLVSGQVVARFFSGDGRPISRAWTLSSVDAVASRPQAVISGDGFLVAWQEGRRGNPSVHMRRLDREGGPRADILVATRAGRPAMALGSTVLITFERCCGPAGGSQIFGRLFDGSGKALGGVFKVAGDLPLGARGPAVSGQPGGDFMVAYQRPIPGNAPRAGIYGQLVSRQGALVGGELALSKGFGEAHSAPAVASLADGGWLVGWISWANGFPVAPTAVAYGPLGNAVGNPHYLNDGALVSPRIALAAGSGGRLMSVWEGFDEAGAVYGVRGRMLSGPSH
jgi:hypothetical protein